MQWTVEVSNSKLETLFASEQSSNLKIYFWSYLGGSKLDYEHCPWAEPHKGVTFGFRLTHIRVIHFAMKTSVLQNSTWQSVSLVCASTGNQLSHP